jgi:prepilin-type N-terminal cleavage/methylation domain-containing protein
MFSRNSAKQRRLNEQGMTLPEVLIALVLLGTITGALMSSLSIIDKTANPTEARVAESGDIKFLQTYIPHDINSATVSDTNPLAQPIAGQTLPGTNVLALTRLESGATVLTSYRYQLVGQRWTLVRYEAGNPMNGGSLTSVTMADELAEPPAGWTPDTPPAHAAVLRQRVPGMILPVGADLEVKFRSGRTFSTGGTGLAAEDHLPPFGFRGPGADQAPPSRCGGPITMVLDISGSIASQNGDGDLKTAANSFVDAFTGTPSSMSVFTFGTDAAALYPANNNGGYIDLLSPNPDITAMKNAINGLTFPGWTNWEDGLFRAFRLDNGQPRSETPGLVVFLTDGQPNQIRNSPYSTGNTPQAEAVQKALDQANYGRGLGSRLVGIMVGSAASDPSSVANMKQVVGTNSWDGAMPGNAAIAEYYQPAGGAFNQLGPVFRAIMSSQCGGTVTVQKFIDQGGALVDPTQVWWYSTETGANDYEPDIEDSITFDYANFVNGAAREVEIIETPNAGFVLDRVECFKGGVAMAPVDYRPLANGVPGVAVKVGPADAVSCNFISTAV